MRELIAIDCAGVVLAGSLDRGDAAVGLLMVAGGTEPRSGAHGGLARLAGRVAAAGFPVLRFDRRGVGDSAGDDRGFLESADDLAAAAAALRARCPGVVRVAGFGLCDGATALALHHRAARLDALLLANPWLSEPADGLPPPAAIRHRYAARLREPAAWRRLLGGEVDLGKALGGLRAIARPRRAPPLAQRLRASLGAVPATALLAARDATALAFAAEHARRPFAGLAVESLDSAAHGFAGAAEADWLAARVVAALRALQHSANEADAD